MEIIDELPFWSAPFGLLLLDTVRISPGIKVLDIGSGSGFPMLELAARLGSSSSVTGLDPSAFCVEVIREKIRTEQLLNSEVVQGVAEQLPFPDGMFGLVTSNNGMNNVRDMEQAFSECYRVCKPGGQFVFTLNLPHTFTEFYDVLEREFAERNLEAEIIRMQDHIFEKRKPVEFIQDLSLNAGFQITSVIPDGFRYRFSDAASFFSHPLIKNFFLPRWTELVPPGYRYEIFTAVRGRLDRKSREHGCLEMSVPFACFDLAR